MEQQKQTSQFMHLDLYSRAGVHYTTKNSTVAKASSSDVINEALRVDGFTSHIIADGFTPTPPTYLYSQDDKGLDQHYAEMLEQVASEKDVLGRKVKSDKNILLAGVVSYPKPRLADNWTMDDRQNYLLFKEQTIVFLKEHWGDNLLCVLEHTDEQYPHLHFYVTNKNSIASTPELHPGHAENIRIENAAKQANVPVNKREQSAAYKEAMRSFQDEFYNTVSIYCGLDRLGPKTQRLSRPEWKQRKRVTKMLAKAYKRLKELIEKNTINAEAQQKAMLELEQQIAAILNMQSELEVEHKELEGGLKDIEFAKFIREKYPQLEAVWKLQKLRDNTKTTAKNKPFKAKLPSGGKYD